MLIKKDVLEEAELLFKSVVVSGATRFEVHDEQVAWKLAAKAGIIRLFREQGARKRHIQTAMGKLFPNVNFSE